MHIAVNTRFLLPGKIEGIGRVTYEVLRRMVINQPEVQFSFLFDRPFEKQYLFADNVKGYSIFPPTRHPILTHTWLQFGVKPFLRKQQPDVYLSFDGFTPMGSKVPTIITIHDLAYRHYPEQNRWADRKYYQRYMPRFAKTAKNIITVSNFSKKDISNTFQISEDKVHTVYNGVDDAFVPISSAEQKLIRTNFSNGAPYLLYVGAIHPRKNVARLISAFDLFKQNDDTDIKLVITGRKSWLVKTVEEALNKATFKSDIIFTNYVPEVDLPKLIAASRALCYVSLFEGFGLPIVEAMSSGVPVICSDRNAMAEIGDTAVALVDPEDVPAIAQAMGKVHRDQNYRNQLIEWGLKRKLDFDWDRAAEQYYEVILNSI